MHYQAHRFRFVPQRDADDGIAEALGLLTRGEPGLDYPLFQQGCEVIGLADAVTANVPDQCELFRQGGFRAECRLQSQTLPEFQPRRLMRVPLQLQELAVALDMPEAICA